jgi:hypothetical protein
VRGAHGVLARQIGHGAGEFQHTMVGAGGELELFRGGAQQGRALFIRRAVGYWVCLAGRAECRARG